MWVTLLDIICDLCDLFHLPVRGCVICSAWFNTGVLFLGRIVFIAPSLKLTWLLGVGLIILLLILLIVLLVVFVLCLYLASLLLPECLYLVYFPSQMLEKGRVSSGPSNVTLVGDDDAITLTNCFFDL